jgi:integrase
MNAANGGADFNAILRGYLREVLEGDDAGRSPLALMPLPVLQHQLAKAMDALGKRDIGQVLGDLERLAAEHGFKGLDRVKLGVGLLEARVRALETAIGRAGGNAATVFTAPVEPRTAPPEAPPAPAPKVPKAPLSSLVEPFFVVRRTRDKITHQVMAQDRATVRWFLEVCGDQAPAAYSRGDVTRFLNTLRRLPTKVGKSPKDKDRPLDDIITEGAALGLPTLTDKTVKRHLSALSQLFRFAVDEGHMSNTQRGELVDDHRFGEAKNARDQRDAWTPDELAKLFKSPVWTGCHEKHRSRPGSAMIKDAKFWLPILALFHGGRLEEFADLRRRDLKCEDGTWFMELVQTDGSNGERERRLKTQSAERSIPLHPELLRLGFIAYAEKVAPGPDAPLFPDLAPQGPDQKRGPRMTRWFVEYRRAIGVYRPGVAMHAFRHAAITRLTDAITTDQQRRHRDFIMGHASGGSEGDVRYDKGASVKAMAETLALLTFPEVDLSHLHVAPSEPG